MKEIDFKKFDFTCIKPKDIRNTGDKLDFIQSSLLIRLESFLLRTNCEIKLEKNAFSHCHTIHNNDFQKKYNTAYYHTNGQAIDFKITNLRDKITIFYNALIVGFQGIGLYYCSETGQYSYHFDIRTTPLFWGGYRLLKTEDWNYMPLLLDPKKGREIINGQPRKQWSV